jgi:hypothetical protein
VLGGRAQSREARVLHYFGSYASGADRGPGALPPFELTHAARWTYPKSCEPRLWLAGSDAVEIIREVDVASPPLDRQALSQFGVENVSAAKIAVSINNYGGQHRFYMDANQWILLFTDSVVIDVVLPRNFERALRSGERGPGLVADIELGANAWEVETSSGQRTAKYTTFHHVPAGTQPGIEVPPYARACSIYQTGAGAASTSWSMFLGGLPGGVELGTIPFIGAARKSVEGIELPSATHLRPDLDAANARFFTIQWAIRP